ARRPAEASRRRAERPRRSAYRRRAGRQVASIGLGQSSPVSLLAEIYASGRYMTQRRSRISLGYLDSGYLPDEIITNIAMNIATKKTTGEKTTKYKILP